MNNAAFSKKSNIPSTKTACGALGKNVGFHKTDGPIMPLEDNLAILKKNGYIVTETADGILIDPPLN